jgi:glycosyltransferase involved in cell wall biosynthesis
VPFVSVIMNCYNSAGYLREALESVRAQTYGDWEIVFWDNQSKDDSAAIFRSYDDPRFRYHLAPAHTPLGEARNLAVEKATGEWIAFLDCDDLWVPQKLQRQVSIIDSEGPDLGLVYGRMRRLVEASGVGSSVERELASGQRRSAERQLPEGDIFAQLLCVDFVPMLCAMVRRSAYWKVGGIDRSFRQAEDHDLFLKIARSYKARAVQDVLGTYRIHGANAYNTEASFAESLKIIERYLPQPEARKGLTYYHTYLAAYHLRQGQIWAGASRLLLHGSLAVLLKKAAALAWTRVTYAARKV